MKGVYRVRPSIGASTRVENYIRCASAELAAEADINSGANLCRSKQTCLTIDPHSKLGIIHYKSTPYQQDR